MVKPRNPEGLGSQDADPLRDGPRVLDRKVKLAKAVLIFERVWRALLWPFAVAGLFLLVAFSGIASLLPPLAHKALLAGFGLAFALSLVPLARIALPTRDEALRRLESASGIKHRPATSFEDELDETASDNERALWAMHRSRIAESLKRLTAGLPHPRLAEADPFALRAALLLLLVIGFAASGGSPTNSVAALFETPGSDSGPRYRIDAWLTPPLYTGKPPIILSGAKKTASSEQLKVPEKSLLLVRVNGPSLTRPGVTIKGADAASGETIKAVSSEKGFAEYKITVKEAMSVNVGRTGFDYATWTFDVLKDTPPEIALTEKPNRAQRGNMRFGFNVKDDYGVAGADARFKLADNGQAKPSDASKTSDESLLKAFEPPDFPLTLPRANAKAAEARAFKNLTAHPWAGLKVEMTLIARDQAGQEGSSEPYTMVLPQRRFTKPLAKAIVEQRRKIVSAPDNRRPVIKALKALTIAPELFMKDTVLYVGLRSVYWRMRHDKSVDGLKSVVGQLWDLALRVEDGDLSQAEADLRAAQDALRKALEEGASEEEIARLVDQLREAMNRFLQAMAEKARQNGDLAKMPEGLGPNQQLSNKDLEEMLRNIENLAKTGSREMAQRMLDQLADMMQRLQMGQSNQNAQNQQMMNTVQGLGDVIQRQQKLLDETFQAMRDALKQREQGQQQGNRQGGEREGRRPGDRDGQRQGGLGQRFGERGDQFGRRPGEQGRSGQQGQRGEGEHGQRGRGRGNGDRRYGGLTDRQGEVRKRLDGLLEQLRSLGAKPPDQLEGAGQAMREAEKALESERLGRATRQQTLALDRLRQGTQSLAEQMLQTLSSRMGQGGQRNRDPFGRPERTQGPDLGTSVKVPDQIDIQRAREILEELRRRLGEPRRPMLELDYLERLIQQF